MRLRLEFGLHTCPSVSNDIVSCGGGQLGGVGVAFVPPPLPAVPKQGEQCYMKYIAFWFIPYSM